MPKQYANPETYEQKLKRVMARMGATEYNYNFYRKGLRKKENAE